MSEPSGNTFDVRITATITATATHPAGLTAEERAHLGLPADDHTDATEGRP